MKRIITLAFCLYVMPSLFAQHVNYKTDSGWFWGLNIGATWNSTDVKNETNAGWGLLVGKSFNYREGALTSFDLRMRYLMGTWYGQDYDTTSLAGYNPAYMPNNLQGYQDNPGYTVNNFSSTNHELGLELAIHANRLRERTGWDPYIFGGANLVWNQTQSDLVNVDSAFGFPGQYDYDPSFLNEASINGTLDGIYETPMNAGSEDLGYNLNFMPSIGVGLGYYFGPRFSIGVEHKTTFTLKDDWDGYEDPTPGLWGSSNDIYHYTSGYLRFHLRGGKQNLDNVQTNNTNNNLTNCPEPKIKLVRPAISGSEVETQVYAFRANVSNIRGIQNVKVRVNGIESTNFFYSTTTKILEGSIVLNEGANQVQIIATNSCGSDVETVVLDYNPCSAPIVTYTHPSHNNVHVDQAAYTVRANVANGGTVSYRVNGRPSTNFYYTANNGNFESSINLIEGDNTIEITVSNECGTDTETIHVLFTDCEDPSVNFLAGNGSILNVTTQTVQVRANVYGVDNMNGIGLRVNGSNKLFSYNSTSNVLQSTVSLSPGANVIQITAGNNCGTQVETLTINYSPCTAPHMSIMTPVASGMTNTSGVQLIKASVMNASQLSQIQMTVNGISIAGGSFNPVTHIYTNNAPLNAGSNVIQLIVTNECGTDSETITIRYNAPCPVPAISMVTNIANTHTATLPLQYVVQNISSSSQVQLTLNGVVVTGGHYNSQSHIFNTTLMLQEGANNITIVASNECGTDSETIVVNFTPPCDDPIISMVNPLGVQTSVTSSQFSVQATLQNVTNANQVHVSVNGTTDNTGTYNVATFLYGNQVALQPGANTIVLTVNNACSVVTKTFVVNYSPCLQPAVSISSPLSGFTQNSSAVVNATVLNVSNSNNIELIVNGAVFTGTFNTTNGAFQSNIPLQTGSNVIQVIASNECGSASESVTVVYRPCNAPTVQLIAPQGAQTQNQSVTVQALVTNVSSASEITLTVNGSQIAGSYNAGTNMFTANVTLNDGANSIVVSAANDCGNASKTKIIRYEAPCDEPVVSIQAPANGLSASGNAIQLIATITNVTSANQIQLTVNGSTVAGGSYNNTTHTFTASVPLSSAQNVIVLTATNECGSDSQTRTVKKKRQQEETMIICHRPPGNPTNTQQLEIPVSAWPAHQAHGDTQGPCEDIDPIVPVEETITICHHPPGNPANTQQLEIPLSAWPAHQAHGDTQGPCPDEPTDPIDEEKMTICHHPPGNPSNTQQLEIPVSAWPAHQAHGDTQGPCPDEPTDPIDEEKITICHHPPGNPDNTQELEIPLSAWPAHEAHGDTQGPCPDEPTDPIDEEKITICHHPPGNPDNTQELEIPLSAWPAHEAHGDTQGPCPTGGNGNNNNNGGGNSNNNGNTNNNGGGNTNNNSGGTVNNGGGNNNGTSSGTTTSGTTSNSTGTGTVTLGGGDNTNTGTGGNTTTSGTTTTTNTGGNTNNGGGNTNNNGGGNTNGNGGGNDNGNNGGGNRTGGSDEEELKKKAAEEAAALKKAQEEANRKAAEEAARKKTQEEANRKAAEEAARKKAQEEANRKAAEEAARKKAQEEANRKAAEEAARKKAQEEANRKAAEEAARKKAQEEANRKAAEEAARKKAQEEANRKAAEEAARKKAQEEANRKAAEEAAKKKAADAAKKKAEEAAKKKADEEAAKKKAAEEKAKEGGRKPATETRGGGK